MALVVGAASRDVVAGDPRGWRLGGAASYVALTLARLGIRVRALVGVDSEAATARELDVLRAAGVELALARLDRGPVFENLEAPGGRTQRCLSESDPVRVSALPAGWGDAPAVLLVPVADELGTEWATIPSVAAFVALGWQGLLRTLHGGETVRRRPPARNALVSRADLIGVSQDDLEPGTSPARLLELMSPGADLVLTRGVGGGVVTGRARADTGDASTEPGTARVWHRYRGIPSDAVIDPTGAGDVFLAAMVATRLEPARVGRPPGRASSTRLAAAAASLVVEAPGLSGVPELATVLRRMRRRSTRIVTS